MKQTIAVVTTSRADYSHLYWPLKELQAHPDVDLKVIALAAHLSPEFGSTVREIEADGFPIAAKLECLLSSDTDVGMAKSIGLGVLSLADALGQMRPDLLLLIADRYEMLAPASVALALRIPIAHIEGGEISEGAIDDAVRNALTKLSHIHFTSTELARQRVINMGEEPWRVHRAGAPSLDHFRRSRLLTRQELQQNLGLDLTQPTILVAYHPVTILRDTTRETVALFEALKELPDQLVFCYPNADAGSRELIDRAERFLKNRRNGRLFINLPAVTYWSLLQNVRLMVGNSSSGIMETGSFALPTVNVGMRQQGRERPANVLDASPTRESILNKIREAQSPEFLQSIEGMSNPYGDGHAAEHIVRVLTTLPSSEQLLLKRAASAECP
ncbi:UDP-N-acetylglucosamine 2-epimerase (hydrolyzing) [Alloacidobacterium dinghuense]|uniref:UDP-N-acetylglucosamine 2-epimerase (Hydrolyzing) n=1 Tax=Alloacidobacterium dinghuense TaxID=2763107 RepID=A0A7G8BQ61_9BACT|nr:UDP-N-acetylglucosamine 2-epimerase [Alloacidobacterium dinghuense]QNI34681.1 UDP-N-acetylglucosamine 2-epimerase (hydrolyzing) [Alloacidobacterium dinghuense]